MDTQYSFILLERLRKMQIICLYSALLTQVCSRNQNFTGYIVCTSLATIALYDIKCFHKINITSLNMHAALSSQYFSSISSPSHCIQQDTQIFLKNNMQFFKSKIDLNIRFRVQSFSIHLQQREGIPTQYPYLILHTYQCIHYTSPPYYFSRSTASN